jgi:hypothetical protein
MNRRNHFPKSVLLVAVTAGTLCVAAHFSLPGNIFALPSGVTTILLCKCTCISDDTVGHTVFGYVNIGISVASGDSTNHCPNEDNKSCKFSNHTGKTKNCAPANRYAPKRSVEDINLVPGKDPGTPNQPTLPGTRIQSVLPGTNLPILQRGVEGEEPAGTTPGTSSPAK